MVNVNHDLMQLVVNLFEGPGQTLGVLAHFQSRGSYAACICSLSRSEQNVVALEYSNSFRSGRHVSAFANCHNAVSNQCLCVILVDFVLGSARQSDVALYSPDALAFEVLRRRNCLNILLDTAAANFLDFLDNIQVDAVLVNDVTVGVRQSNNLCAQSSCLLGSVDCYVAGTGDNNGLALEGSTMILQHSVNQVAQAVTGSFGTSQGTTPLQALAGQNANVLVADTLVLAEHIADFTCASADIASRYVGVSTDMAAQLSHKCLAETHDFSVRLALRVEVRTTLAAADRQAGQAVLEDLLEAQELDDGSAYGRMQTDTALVRSDCRVELVTETTVNLNLAVVINPSDTELDAAFRLNDALEHASLYQVRTALSYRLEGLQNFVDCLLEFRLTSIALYNGVIDTLQIGVSNSHFRFSSIHYGLITSSVNNDTTSLAI